jgi:fructokinase
VDHQREILCVGEVLWDALPEGLYLGGAPFNVACHLHALGEEVAMVSRVGEDRLGREALRRLKARGMTTALVQVDADLETGFVKVALDDSGGAEYVIVQPAAWDALTLTGALSERASEAAALVFGTLAQRRERARRTVRALCDMRDDTVKVLDVNLRPPYGQRSVIEASLDLADVAKLNEQELFKISGWLDLSGDLRGTVAALARRFGCRAVCVTRGAEGSALWRDGEWTRRGSYSVSVQDTVGAGDAFLAALLAGLLDGQASDVVLARANRLGAYVASRAGGTPAYDIGRWSDIPQLALDTPEPAEAAR